jgi:hypothetical protein
MTPAFLPPGRALHTGGIRISALIVDKAADAVVAAAAVWMGSHLPAAIGFLSKWAQHLPW